MTEAEFTRQLSELSEVASQLNAESDSINELLTTAEDQIRVLNVGLEESVSLPGFPGTLLCWTSSYAFEDGKQKRVWRIELKTHDEEEGSDDWRHILECSRNERIAALEGLPALIVRLTNAAQARLKTIRQAKKIIMATPGTVPPPAPAR